MVRGWVDGVREGLKKEGAVLGAQFLFKEEKDRE